MEILQQVGQWSGYFLWSFLLIAASLFVYLGLGGTFIIIGLALVHALFTGFDPITWKLLLVLLGLALLGEGIEFVVGTFYVAKKGASKAGVIGFTRALAKELGEFNIHVNCVAPGYMKTEIPRETTSPERERAILNSQCVKRFGVPQDLLGVILFLASDAARAVHGTAVPVYGLS